MHGQNIADKILQGFKGHYSTFQQVTKRVPAAFAKQNWKIVDEISKQRIDLYDKKVNETVEQLRKILPGRPQLAANIWHQVKESYAERLTFHPQAELAETFYNSVFCRLFHRKYYKNEFIFVESTLENNTTLPVDTEYRSYFPVVHGIKPTVRKIFSDVEFLCPFADLENDIRLLLKAFYKQAPNTHHQPHLMRFDMLQYPFYRNKGAYLIGRVVSQSGIQPFIISVLHNQNGKLYIDALLTKSSQMRVIFGFARAYFLVNTNSPSALVKFLNQLMPNKTKAELYNAIGFHKQGKTEFYREFLSHLNASDEQFEIAKGTPGMVMMVFTLPSFPYVFKVIKDAFPESKPFGRDTVIQRYQLVKRHDRVGRMADTIEYSDVVIPRNRFSNELYLQLRKTIATSMYEEGDNVIIKHLYIERRMIPLNIYLAEVDDETCRQIIKDYGQALKEMISVNIFPGDMLLKNFGVSRHKRVIFYDYDEVQYLSDMNFRSLPTQTLDDVYSYEEVSVAPQDVFPEQLCTFVLTNPKLRSIFFEYHPELAEARFWQQAQDKIKRGLANHIFPYPDENRFARSDKSAK
ncbi:bifunctional isocitrate dehydrogenase kinase/phosphatase [Pseudoalteromonas sp. T1lg65]|uniref:bifunctional isocitrate dehydrogenase kinase/phosphatase n=1 Tax=Pseudoalteromonas sp. T1lg65 TaxID=2077101 RepID=UPI003F78C0CE